MTSSLLDIGLDFAKEVAGRFTYYLAPVTERMLIVGSIRRGREVVHDIDIVAMPAYGPKPDWFGGTVTVNKLEQCIGALIEKGVAKPRLKKNGTKMVGHGVAFLEFEGKPVDIYYCPSEEQWWGLVLVRTGSAAHNQALASMALQQGKRFHADGFGISDADGHRLDDGKSEESIFEALGVPYREPDRREIPGVV